MTSLHTTQKLLIKIRACSGQDQDYPVSELIAHTPFTKGWQSARFCEYPQEIVIQFVGPMKVRSIQILSHQSKISSKIDFYAFLPDFSLPYPSSEIKYSKLGYVTLDSNEKTGYQQRELKTVNLQAPSLLFKMVLHKCHINKFNLFNQVGLIALQFFGEPLSQTTHNVQFNTLLNPKFPMYDRLEYEMKFDALTLNMLKKLELLKQKAVNMNDFEEAIKIKQIIEKCKRVGEQIMHLEERRIIAMKNEDYDSAKVLTEEIEYLKKGIFTEKYSVMSVNRSLPDFPMQIQNKRAGGLKEDFKQKQNNEYEVIDDVNRMAAQINFKSKIKQSREVLQNEINQEQQNQIQATQKDQQNHKNDVVNQNKPISQEQEEENQINFSKQPKVDGETLQNKDFEKEQMEIESNKKRKADQINFELLEQAESITKVIGRELGESLFQNNWGIKSEALKQIEKNLLNNLYKQYELKDQYTALFGVCRYTVGDKIASVVQQSLNLILIFLENQKVQNIQIKSELYNYIDFVLNKCIEKIGETALKLKELSEKILIEIVDKKLIDLNSCVKRLMNPSNKKVGSSRRHSQSRIEMVNKLLFSKGTQNNEILESEVLEFAVLNSENQFDEIRKASLDLFVLIGKSTNSSLLNKYIELLRESHKQYVKNKLQNQ